MKLIAEDLRQLALAGAQIQLRDLLLETVRLREIIKYLSRATPAAADRAKKERPKKLKRRSYEPAFRADVVKEAATSGIAATARRRDVPESVVSSWVSKAKRNTK